MNKNYLIVIVLAFWGILATLSFVIEPFCSYIDYMVCILGFVGLVYSIRFLWFCFARPIERDLIVIKGKFLWKVLFLVFLLPFTLTLGMEIANEIQEYKNEKELFFPCEMASDVDLYEIPDSMKETLNYEFKAPSLFWTVYFHFVDPGNQHMAVTSMLGRVSAALIAMLGIFLLNGLLVSSIIGWVDKRKELWQSGGIRYKLRFIGKNRFAVVIGAHEIASSVIRNLLTPKQKGDINFKSEGENDYVILYTNREVQSVRETLESHLPKGMIDKVLIYNGLRNSKSGLEELFFFDATEIYVLGESEVWDRGESYHDALNMQCVNCIAEILNEKRLQNSQYNREAVIKRKVCKVLFDYQTTSSIFQFSDISNKIKRNLVFIPFNRYESWARKVIVEGFYQPEIGTSLIDYLPLDGKGLKEDSEKYVHLVIVGMSKMGIAMGVQAMLQCHYLNYKKARTRITFIDTNADKELAFFKGRYYNLFELARHRYIEACKCSDEELDNSCDWIDPVECKDSIWKHLSADGRNFIDIELEFIKGEIESDAVRKYLCQIAQEKDALLTISVCLNLTHQAIAAALYMPIEVYRSKFLQQIWVYQRESADVVMNLYNTEQADLRYKKLRPFGMLHGEYMNDRRVYLKAVLANGAYDLNGNCKACERNLGIKDTYVDLRASWKKLSIEKRWSNKYFVDSIYLKIRSLLKEQLSDGETTYSWNSLFERENLQECLTVALKNKEELLAECEHNRWVVQQLLMGFSACNVEQDRMLCQLNQELKAAYLTRKESNSDYEQKKQMFKMQKEQLKNSQERNHPNICDYAHLDCVDFQAKDYDKYLNNAIPTILILVDGHGKLKLKEA